MGALGTPLLIEVIDSDIIDLSIVVTSNGNVEIQLSQRGAVVNTAVVGGDLGYDLVALDGELGDLSSDLATANSSGSSDLNASSDA